MLYNEPVTYNEASVTYIGVIQINVPGFSNPIVLNDITLIISTEPDFSNAATIGVVTYDFAPTGIVTIEATAEQAEALVAAEIIYINSISGEVSIQKI